MPAEGVETREGATSTMMALRPGDLALSLPTRADDALLAEAEEACAGRGAHVLASPRARHRGSTARRRQHLPRRRRAERVDRPRPRARRRHARVDRRLLPRRERPRVSLGLGVIGCGSVFAGPYRGMIASLATAGRVHVSAVYDVDDRKRRGAAEHYGVDPELIGPDAVISHPEVDVVLVLTSMNEHGPLTKAALEAGRHVLVEKPIATSLDEAAALSSCRGRRPGLLVCAPHILLSPTFRAIHAAVRQGEVGRLLSGRARYGWAGPDWNEWFYQPGGGSLFDLGVYNVTSLCALFGPARRVTAMVGVADSRAHRQRTGRPGRGRGQRPGAARLRRVALRLGHDRVHDAEVPLPRDRALRQRGHDPAARRRLGARGLGAVAERGGVVAPLPRVRPALAVDRGPAPPRRLRRVRPTRRSPGPSTPTTPSRSCSPRRRPGATGSRARSRATFPIRSTRTEWLGAEHDRYAHDRRSHDGL